MPAISLANILTHDRCLIDVDCHTQKAAIQTLSEIIAKDLANIDAHELFLQLLEREKLGSTAIGHGVAIPHVRSKNVSSPIGAFIRLTSKIDFYAEDGHGVDILFGLVVPENVEQAHLEILALLATLFSDEKNRQIARSNNDTKQMWESLIKISNKLKVNTHE